jgi:hypothetical protein
MSNERTRSAGPEQAYPQDIPVRGMLDLVWERAHELTADLGANGAAALGLGPAVQ